MSPFLVSLSPSVKINKVHLLLSVFSGVPVDLPQRQQMQNELYAHSIIHARFRYDACPRRQFNKYNVKTALESRT